jgi:hypothetical protein
MRSRTRRVGAALLVLASTVLVGTSCASIPSSSPPQIIPESVPASAPADDEDLRYDEIVPRPNEAPEDIVSDFLRASGSFERAHTRARAYLTSKASRNWKDTTGAIILEDTPYLNVGDGGAVVEMSTLQRGKLNDDGSYVAGSGQPYRFSFHLIRTNGNWRIDNPPDVLLLEQGTFDSSYRPYDVYFLNSTRTKVVPDVRWYAAAPDTLPSLLVTAIERGPSQWLQDSVISDLAGITLQNNIEQESDRVKVYLTGLDDQADTLTAGGFAQLVWTLNQLGVGGVEVFADGQLITPKSAPGRKLQQLSDWRSFDPDGLSVSASAYYVRGGAVWTTRDAPLPGPAGRDTFGAVSVAASTDERSIAVVRRSAAGRQVLFVGAPGALRPTFSASSLTRPTWGPETREVWTVRDGRDVILVPVDGQATRIGLPTDALGHIRSLSLSRDGSRLAIVAGTSGHEQLWVGIVSRENGATRVEGLRPLDLGDDAVSDVSWTDAVSLVVLTHAGQQDSSLYSVDADGAADGQLIATIGLPGPPTAVAAAPSLPLLTVAAGSLWRTPAPGENWTKVEDRPGSESAPAYPG